MVDGQRGDGILVVLNRPRLLVELVRLKDLDKRVRSRGYELPAAREVPPRSGEGSDAAGGGERAAYLPSGV